MLQDLRDYWLPLMLFAGTLLIAIVLLLLVALMPFAIEYLPIPPLTWRFLENLHGPEEQHS